MLLALALCSAVLTIVLGGNDGPGTASAAVPPPVTIVVTAPPPAAAGAAPAAAKPKPRKRKRAERIFKANDAAHTALSWVSSFYPIYATAQKVYGVNWLLIASIHKQETAFSTSAGTYEGLNFAHCCAGPMQFNVTNGPVSTWQRFGNAYLYGRRPKTYGHQTPDHPSVYDDFDSVMAGAALLRTAGASSALDASAWRAAYDYYGHDLTGVDYADQVLARAIGWTQHGFCINCEADRSLVAAVEAAYGAPVRNAAK